MKKVKLMECPYCGKELTLTDHYGTGRQESFYGTAANGIRYPSTYRKLGDIYKCDNASGFDTVEEVMEYLGLNSEDDLEKYMKVDGISNWEDLVCESDCFSGNFYTDECGNLNEGYPC